MKNKKLIKSIGLLLVAIAFGASQAEAASKSVKIDGSSTVYPITEAVAEEFGAETRGKVRVTVGVSGSGGGFKKFCSGEIDIANASRVIKDSEAKACAANGIEFIELPIAYDGIAVVANKQNKWMNTITVAELKKLWEPSAQGKITKWNQVNPKWPAEEIRLLGPGVDSGTFDYFTKAINGKEGASRGDFMASEDDHVLVKGVSGDKNALGFFGLAYYEENKGSLKLVAVDGGKGGVKASVETVNNGSYTPLSRPIFIYVSKKSLAKTEVADFVSFYLEMTAELSMEVGYIDLPKDLAPLIKKRFDNRVTGSAYKGAKKGTTVKELYSK